MIAFRMKAPIQLANNYDKILLDKKVSIVAAKAWQEFNKCKCLLPKKYYFMEVELMDKEDLLKEAIIWTTMNPKKTSFQCGYCGKSVISDEGMEATIAEPYEYSSLARYINKSMDNGKVIGVFICPNCNKPTFIDEIINTTQFPLPRRENKLHHIPSEVNKVYQEALDSYSAGAFTGTTLLCRKLLMNIAVNLGAKENQNFAEYVKFLDDEGYITKTSHDWVDIIRKIGNKATHNLDVSTKEEAENVLTFCEMLLKTNYEYPNEVFNNKEDLESNK